MTMTMAQAREHWVAEVDGLLSAYADELVKEGRAEWQSDPFHEGVYGLVKTGTNKALAIIYTDVKLEGGVIDFEEDDDFAREAYDRAQTRTCSHPEVIRLVVGAPGVGWVERCAVCKEIVKDCSRILEPWETR